MQKLIILISNTKISKPMGFSATYFLRERAKAEFDLLKKYDLGPSLKK
jgi:hypothetical protein